MIEGLLSHFQPLIIATAYDGDGAICILMHNASVAPLPSGGVVMETLYACCVYSSGQNGCSQWKSTLDFLLTCYVYNSS